MQGVMIVYAIFAGIVILIFVIVLVATVIVRITERFRKRRSAPNSRDHISHENSRIETGDDVRR